MSSSSESERCEHIEYEGFGLPSNMNCPLVYYARTIEPHQQHSNQNCFTKAFQWYTQAHSPRKGTNQPSDSESFARWLDQKYFQFLQEGQTPFVMNKTSTVRLDTKECNGCKNSSYNSRQRRKFKRFRSPWRKRKKVDQMESKADGMGSNQSVKVILKPKMLPRTVSECRQSAGVDACCCRRVPADQTAAARTTDGLLYKSKSAISVLKETEVYLPFDYANDTANGKILWIPLDMIQKKKPPPTPWNTILPTETNYQSDSTKTKKSELKPDWTKQKQRDTSCQCSCPNETRNACSQYEAKTNKKSVLSECCCPTEVQTKLELKEANGGKIKENLTSSTKPCHPCQPWHGVAETLDTTANISAQTSEHSIKLGYTTYMKIVNADKLI